MAGGTLPLRESLTDGARAVRAGLAPMYGAALLGYSASLTIQGLAATGRSPANLSANAVTGLLFIELVLSVLSEAALVYMAGRALAGTEVRLGEAYGRMALRLPAYAITAVMAGLVSALGFVMLIVPGLIAAGAFAFWRQTVALDGQGGSQALGRSVVVTRPWLWKVVGLLTVVWLTRLSFIEPAIMAAQTVKSVSVQAFLVRNTTRIDAVVLGALVWRLLLDPLVIAFTSALYVRLATDAGVPSSVVLTLGPNGVPGAERDAGPDKEDDTTAADEDVTLAADEQDGTASGEPREGSDDGQA